MLSRVKSKKFLKILSVCAVMLCVFSAFAVTAAAEGENEVDVASIVSSSFGDVASDMTSVVTSILPIALGLIGLVLAIFFGIKLFKKFTGKAG